MEGQGKCTCIQYVNNTKETQAGRKYIKNWKENVYDSKVNIYLLAECLTGPLHFIGFLQTAI